MPTTTNFALPYPGPLDEPCDFAQDWCAFTDASAAVLQGFQDIANRTNPVQPVARLELNTTITIVASSLLPFDTVNFDNAGFVDFDASRTTITLKRPGRYIGIFNAFVSGTATPTSRFIIDWSGAPQLGNLSYELDMASTSVGMVANNLFIMSGTPVEIAIELGNTASPATLTVQRATLSVFWHADGTAP